MRGWVGPSQVRSRTAVKSRNGPDGSCCGSLRHAVSYPDDAERHSDEEIREALKASAK